MQEFSVYEVTDSVDIEEQPAVSPHTRWIGSVEAANLTEAYERAKDEYGAPIAVE